MCVLCARVTKPIARRSFESNSAVLVGYVFVFACLFFSDREESRRSPRHGEFKGMVKSQAW